ncbi:hypothetical protein CRENBAI_012941 [Crenichthys baileyi]|uniref:Uncharacterized protein n=1 Tax=Crenichthys baileyi TaxID=28760 RepID=A0AAV9QZ15_9TELE
MFPPNLDLVDDHQASSIDFFTFLSREAEKTLCRSAGLSVPQSAYDGSRLAIPCLGTGPLRSSPPLHTAVKPSSSSRRKKRRRGAPSCVSAGEEESPTAAAAKPGAHCLPGSLQLRPCRLRSLQLADGEDEGDYETAVRQFYCRPLSTPGLQGAAAAAAAAEQPTPGLQGAPAAAEQPTPGLQGAPAAAEQSTPGLQEAAAAAAEQPTPGLQGAAAAAEQPTPGLQGAAAAAEQPTPGIQEAAAAAAEQPTPGLQGAAAAEQPTPGLQSAAAEQPTPGFQSAAAEQPTPGLQSAAAEQPTSGLQSAAAEQSTPGLQPAVELPEGPEGGLPPLSGPEHLLSFLWGVLTELKPDTHHDILYATPQPDSRPDTPQPRMTPDPRSASTPSTRRRGYRKRAQVIGGPGDASVPAHTTEGLGDASAHATEGLGDASAHATEGHADASAHATEGLCDASAPTHVTEGPADASAPSLQGFSGKLVLVLASDPCDEGFEEEEPPDHVFEGFKEQFVLVLALEPLDEGFKEEAPPDPVSGEFKEQLFLVLVTEDSPDSVPVSGGPQALLQPPRVCLALLQPLRAGLLTNLQVPVAGRHGLYAFVTGFHAFAVDRPELCVAGPGARLNFVPARDDLLVAHLNFVPARDDLLVARLNSVPARDAPLVAHLNSVPARDDPLVARLNFVSPAPYIHSCSVVHCGNIIQIMLMLKSYFLDHAMPVLAACFCFIPASSVSEFLFIKSLITYHHAACSSAFWGPT